MLEVRRYLEIISGIICLISNSSAAEPLVLQLKWRHQFQFAGYYAAIEKGYYRNAGFDVELKEAQPGEDPVSEVVAGRAQYGVGTSNLILTRAEGKPLVVLAVIYQHSPFVLLASTRSGVKDIHDLADKPILIEPDSAELLAYFQSEGIDPSTLKLQPHTFNVGDLINGKAAAMSAYSTDEPFHMKEAGEKYLVFTPRAGGIDFYGDNLFTTENEIKNHPERTKAFLNASLKGWEYAMAHPEEMIAIIKRDYDRGKSVEQLTFEARETAKLVHPELIELGYINPGRWQDIANTYVNLGMLSKNFSLKGFLYERNPKLNLQPFYWTGGMVLLIALIAVGWSALVWSHNQKLLREVNAREQAEALVRAESEAKTQFYAILAHEVRAPLSGILSTLWLGQSSDTIAIKNQTLAISEGAAKNLLLLLDRILDHSKMESGKLEIESVPVNLPLFLSGMIRDFQASAIAKGIVLTFEIAGGTPDVLNTDPVRLRQILSNLLSNAIKFTQSGNVRVDLQSEKTEEAYRLFFKITDTGYGIPSDQLTDIFEPYTQSNAKAQTDVGGTGLGLTISARLAKLLGGEIKVTSEKGAGSVFTVSILARSGPEISGF